MARNLRCLSGHRVAWWIEEQTSGNGVRKVRVIQHVKDLGWADGDCDTHVGRVAKRNRSRFAPNVETPTGECLRVQLKSATSSRPSGPSYGVQGMRSLRFCGGEWMCRHSRGNAVNDAVRTFSQMAVIQASSIYSLAPPNNVECFIKSGLRCLIHAHFVLDHILLHGRQQLVVTKLLEGSLILPDIQDMNAVGGLGGHMHD